jgi:hypothetical protein
MGVKIFGIGLGKTGTTSLHFALEELGFRSIHCYSHVHNALSEESGDFDAFIDYPIWCFYKRLDRQYPGSKFILTVRDPLEQYESTLRHAEEFNRQEREKGRRPGWYVPRSRALFVAHVRAHNNAVVRHFAGRGEQLLVLNIFDRRVNPWAPLSAFLARPQPAAAFPHVNAGGERAVTYIRSRAVDPRPIRHTLSYFRALNWDQVIVAGLMRLISRPP